MYSMFSWCNAIFIFTRHFTGENEKHDGRAYLYTVGLHQYVWIEIDPIIVSKTLDVHGSFYYRYRLSQEGSVTHVGMHPATPHITIIAPPKNSNP